MVVLTSPQPNELEQKKKRQTVERAKAAHLSKQLQMRLQYAKLKVEHGWQRQNLNEVENLYFHHSHLRNIRQQRFHFAALSPSGAPLPTETHVSSPALPGQTTADPISQSPPEHSHPTPAPVIPSDLSDPNVLARLAQLQAQVQATSQPQSQSQSPPLSCQPSTIIPKTTSASQSTSGPNAFPPHTQLSHPQSDFVLPVYAAQPLILASTSASTPHHSALPLQPAAASAAPMPAPPISTPTSIAPAALTYDSFWSTHASSTGPTRALYRTHTGFTASATSTGNVAMLTPGGHAAVLTAEGVYVGGSRSG